MYACFATSIFCLTQQELDGITCCQHKEKKEKKKERKKRRKKNERAKLDKLMYVI